MVRITVVLAGFLALSACGTKQESEQQTGVEENINVVTAQGNDVTAIDAATSDDANMAADVEFTLNETGDVENGTENASNVE
ncbi:hypothetical protein [Sphingomonas arenae]|uniref:hypothetical protein n=1 Tax=Sphingomonas arenae TaxID=2812555 RepID=UPI001967A939|nr:hypothetical protein [Sphingomonas arenae]